MWVILQWVLGIGIAVLSILFVVLIIRRESIEKKPILLIKYLLLALVPLTWGIGNCVAESDPGRYKAGCVGLLLLILAAAAAYWGDIRKDI